ncbi:MAG: hypothetical protein IT205_08615 [Fimbriimonadaceae bacterium]|nr:hypothetical protein [Fimbriimonadaceae bacterium]
MVELPVKTGTPPSPSFTKEGERQIYDAIKSGEATKAEVQFRCQISHTTLYDLLKRVDARLKSGEGAA